MATTVPEPVCLRIEPDPHHRIACIHEALRDLGLELCSHCGIWKGADRFAGPLAAPITGSFATTICTPCRTGERP